MSNWFTMCTKIPPVWVLSSKWIQKNLEQLEKFTAEHWSQQPSGQCAPGENGLKDRETGSSVSNEPSVIYNIGPTVSDTLVYCPLISWKSIESISLLQSSLSPSNRVPLVIDDHRLSIVVSNIQTENKSSRLQFVSTLNILLLHWNFEFIDLFRVRSTFQLVRSWRCWSKFLKQLWLTYWQRLFRCEDSFDIGWDWLQLWRFDIVSVNIDCRL